MLFDLRGRGRRRTVQVIYLGLAILMGGGLVLFGIGGSTSGVCSTRSTATTAAPEPAPTACRRRTTRDARPPGNPQNARLGRARPRAYQLAGTAPVTTRPPARSRQGQGEARVAARDAWERYLALEAKTPDPALASPHGPGLQPGRAERPEKAVAAQEIMVDDRVPRADLYAQLAVLAYQAGQTRKGDLVLGEGRRAGAQGSGEAAQGAARRPKTQARRRRPAPPAPADARPTTADARRYPVDRPRPCSSTGRAADS